MNIKQVIIDHGVWLKGQGGVRAILSDADLRGANLSYANLRGAILSDADLRGANLSDANLSDANLIYADLSYANLSDANLIYADLSYANLSYANLRGADLRGANLSYANLKYCIGNMKQVKTLQCDTWLVIYTSTHLNIGCQTHTIDKWFDFSNGEISSMDKEALTWWKVWKPILKNIIEVSPAE